MNNFTNTTVPNFIDLCGSNANPSFVQATSGDVYNLNFPGTPPYKLTGSMQTGNGNMSYCGKLLAGSLNTSNFAWSASETSFYPITPPFEIVESDDGSRYEVQIPYNGSIVWIATEMQGNVSDKDAINTAYTSSNFSFDPMATEVRERENGASQITSSWLHMGLTFMLLGSLVGGVWSL